jgi:hypothetical protein
MFRTLPLPCVDIFDGSRKVLDCEPTILPGWRKERLTELGWAGVPEKSPVVECELAAPKLSRNVLIISRYCFWSKRHELRRAEKWSSWVPCFTSAPPYSTENMCYSLCVLVLCTQVNMMFVMLLWVCIHIGQAETFAWPRWESNPRPLGY